MVSLTKPKFMNGEQCARFLWFANKKQLPELTLPDKHKFAQAMALRNLLKCFILNS